MGQKLSKISSSTAAATTLYSGPYIWGLSKNPIDSMIYYTLAHINELWKIATTGGSRTLVISPTYPIYLDYTLQNLFDCYLSYCCSVDTVERVTLITHY